MRKWQRVALSAALTAATAGGVAFAGVAAKLIPRLASLRSGTQRQAS